VSAESLAAYPPGIPTCCLAKIITEEVILPAPHGAFAVRHVRGAAKPDLSRMRVLMK